MKRDMDLIRQILLAIEADPQADGSRRHLDLKLEGRSPDEVTYHVRLLDEAGFIEVWDQSNMSGKSVHPTGLT